MFNTLLWILVAVSAVCSVIGFKKFIWFLSIGYGIAVSGCGAAMLVYTLVKGNFNIAGILFSVLLVVYGLRLGLFLLIREFRNKSYKAVLDAQTGNKVPVFVSIAVWICMAFLYAAEVSPVAYRIWNGDAANAAQWIGLVISALGLTIEAVADKQKTAAKAIDPKKPAMTGLYKIVRCPNYFGEMVVWVGVLVSGIGSVRGIQWILAAVGFISIEYIMISGGKRVGNRQNRSYMDVPGFREYIQKTPVLIPLIPWYITGIAEEKPKKEK